MDIKDEELLKLDLKHIQIKLSITKTKSYRICNIKTYKNTIEPRKLNKGKKKLKRA